MVEGADWPTERQGEWADRWRTEEENLRVAIRWFCTHDIAPLPHLFRVLWLFWQMRGRMPEGRAWIREVQGRTDVLDDRARTELLFTSAITAVEVGDDDSALAAVDGLRRLEGRIDDPYLDSAAQLAIAWALPIVDDFDGALRAASEALDGFRSRDEPFVPFAVLTLGRLELALGRLDAARAHLTEVARLGGRLDNFWLTSAARSQLAALEVRSGSLEKAEALLLESVDPGADTDPSTLTLTFSLVASAHLALARGDGRRAATALGAAEGLRRRAGLRAWPAARRGEAELIGRVTREIGAEAYADAVAEGAGFGSREAVGLIRRP
jgi:tetratricopeptide (TPR) repeat protein